MARAYHSPSDLTDNERRVLRLMVLRSNAAQASANFACIATNHSDYSQWAKPILKRLVEFGLVALAETKLGTASAYKILPAGCEASRQAPPALPEMTIFEMKAVLEMHENGRIKVDGNCDPELMLGAQDAFYNDLCSFEPASNGTGAHLYWLNDSGRFIDPASLRAAIQDHENSKETPSP